MVGTIVLIVGLIALAMVLFLLEILTPSLGLLAIMGVGALIGAIWAAFSIHAAFGWALLVTAPVLAVSYIVVLRKRLPSSKLGKMVFLGRAPDSSGEGTPKAVGLGELIGAEGVATTDLRPAGKVRIDDRRVDARAESTVIDCDRPVRVIDATGTEVIVREIEADEADEAGEGDAGDDEK